MFNLGALFHAEALKVIAVQVLQAAKPAIDSAIEAGKVLADGAVASQPMAAPLQGVVDGAIAKGKEFTDTEIDAIVARLLHLASKQEIKAEAHVS